MWVCLLPPLEGLAGAPPGGCSPPAEPSLTSRSPAVYTQLIHPTHFTSPGQVVLAIFMACFVVCRHVCACAQTHTDTHTRGVHTSPHHPLPLLQVLFTHSPTSTLSQAAMPTHPPYLHHMPLPPHTDTHAGTPSQVPPLRSWDALTLAHAHGHIHMCIHVIFIQTHSWAGAELGRGPGTAAVLERAHV